MAVDAGALAVGFDELAVLKLLGLDGAHRGEVKISCSELAARLEVSNQTASRRLQALEDAGYLGREMVSDGQFVEITDSGIAALKRQYEDYRAIFEKKADLVLEGTITSGMGEGRHYISLPGYNAQFKEKLGYEPYPGTLNVTLAASSKRERSAMESFEAVHITEWEDEERTYGGAFCYPAMVEAPDGRVFDRTHVIVPDRTHHDEDQLEIIAPEKLRDELGLLDGDEVSVRVEAA
jgi:riboflavin kinase